MTTLGQLSLTRAGLPTFPGSTPQEQLLAGRAAAQAILLKYRPNLFFDQSAASLLMRQIGVWEDRNQSTLETLMQDPNASALPDQIRLTFGSDKAQAFIVAGFTLAAIGLGPWVSGAVDKAVSMSKPGDLLQPAWAQSDAEARLQIFASIVKMENDGYLDKLFNRPSSLGFFPVAIEGSTLVWALVVTLVAVAALVLGYLYLTKIVELNNRTMNNLCAKAQAQGDTATVQACIEQAAGLQKPAFGGDIAKAVGQAAAIVGVVWVLVKFLPGWWRR